MTIAIKLNLKLRAPKLVTQANPVVLSITKVQCFDIVPKRKGKPKLVLRKSKVGWGTQDDPFPGSVELAFVERDTWTSSDDVISDTLVARNAIKDDTIVTIPGQLGPHPAKKTAAIFIPDETEIVKAISTVTKLSPDIAWFNFDGRTTDAFQVPIPKHKEEGNDGFFYEFSALVTKLPAGLEGRGDPAKVVAVRRARSRHRVLAVEPLAQANTPSSSRVLRVMLDAFHSGATKDEKAQLKDRAWSKYMLRRTSENSFQSIFRDSACSLIVLTMVLRYLRTTDGEELPSLFDNVIGPMIKQKKFEARYAPRELLHNNSRHITALGKVYAGNKKKSARTALKAFLDDNGVATDPDFFGVDFEITTHDDTSDRAKDFIGIASLRQSHYWPVMLLWYIRQMQGIEEDYAIELLTARKQVLEDVDGVPTLTLSPLTTGKNKDPVILLRPKTKEVVAEKGKYYASTKGYASPPTAAMRKDFGFSSKETSVESLGKGWLDFVTDTIDEGLPIIVLLSPGVYTQALGLGSIGFNGARKKTTSGHWVVIAGYREDSDGRLRLILNDPARGDALQYDALYEDEVEEFTDELLVELATAVNARGTALNEKNAKKRKWKNLPTDITADALRDDSTESRERNGANLFLDRRKFLTPRLFYVLTPKGWSPGTAKVLEYDGRSKWKDVSPSALVAKPTPPDPATVTDDEDADGDV